MGDRESRTIGTARQYYSQRYEGADTVRGETAKACRRPFRVDKQSTRTSARTRGAYDSRSRRAYQRADKKRKVPACCTAGRGMRRGEARGLRWEDIGDGVIRIQHNWQDMEGIKTPKRDSERTVPILRTVADTLDKLERGDEGFVFPGANGEPVGTTWFWGVFRHAMFAIGIDEAQIKARHLTYHGLRHTYITLGRMTGISAPEIQALGGNKRWRETERYSHVPHVLDYDRAREKLERAITSG